jgi:hypothetical protein
MPNTKINLVRQSVTPVPGIYYHRVAILYIACPVYLLELAIVAAGLGLEEEVDLVRRVEKILVRCARLAVSREHGPGRIVKFGLAPVRYSLQSSPTGFRTTIFSTFKKTRAHLQKPT